jgi:hypothetical protein
LKGVCSGVDPAAFQLDDRQIDFVLYARAAISDGFTQHLVGFVHAVELD